MDLPPFDNRRAKFVQSDSFSYGFSLMKVLATISLLFRARIFIDFMAV